MKDGKKILIVDDDNGILEGFLAVLEPEGYTVQITTNANFSATLTVENLPDLILLDLLLSGKDGRDVCRQLKTNHITSHIPIIIVSAHPKAYASIIEAGADDFIAKPFEMDTLLQVIKKHFP